MISESWDSPPTLVCLGPIPFRFQVTNRRRRLNVDTLLFRAVIQVPAGVGGGFFGAGGGFDRVRFGCPGCGPLVDVLGVSDGLAVGSVGKKCLRDGVPGGGAFVCVRVLLVVWVQGFPFLFSVRQSVLSSVLCWAESPSVQVFRPFARLSFRPFCAGNLSLRCHADR